VIIFYLTLIVSYQIDPVSCVFVLTHILVCFSIDPVSCMFVLTHILVCFSRNNLLVNIT